MIRVLTISCFVWISACSPKKATPPTDLIPEHKMINLLVDIRLLEGAYSVKYREVDTSDFKIEAYYRKLFQDGDYTLEQFTKSYSYYSQQDGKMPEIENVVMERLSEIQANQENSGK